MKNKQDGALIMRLNPKHYSVNSLFETITTLEKLAYATSDKEQQYLIGVAKNGLIEQYQQETGIIANREKAYYDYQKDKRTNKRGLKD